MAKKQPDTNIPQHEIEALARCLLPEIQKFFESPEGKKEFEEWKAQRAKETEKERYENYFIMPMIPLNMEELKIDIFSVFLLIPISQFFKEFKEFVEYSRETQRVPVATEDWLRYLSEKAVLSEFYTACGYQYLRSVGYWIYLGHKGEAEDIKKLGMPIKEQSEIRKRQRIFLMKK